MLLTVVELELLLLILLSEPGPVLLIVLVTGAGAVRATAVTGALDCWLLTGVTAAGGQLVTCGAGAEERLITGVA